MKRLIRTVSGKTILFILCICSVCMLGISMFAAVFMVNEEYYTHTEERVFYDQIQYTLLNSGYALVRDAAGEVLSAGNDDSNLLYELLDEQGVRLVASPSYDQAETEDFLYTAEYGVLRNEAGEVTDVYYHAPGEADDAIAEYYTVYYRFRKGFPELDSFSNIYYFTRITYSLRYWVFPLGLLALILSIATFILLMCAAARRPDSDGLFPGPLNGVPLDLMIAAILFSAFFLVSLYYNSYWDLSILILVGLLVYLHLGLGLCVSIAARVKQKTLWHNTLIGALLRQIKKLGWFLLTLIRGLPLVWRTALVLAALAAAEFLAIVQFSWNVETLLLYWLLSRMLLIPVVLHIAMTLRKLQASGTALAQGDLNHQTDTRGMYWDFKCHGENLNSIAKGMSIAVGKQLKSERMKTELITNVSHDLKTPLTSIVNYAGLISKEPCENPKITEYTEVLVRQSQRLTRLIEDLVEASKASTGNLDVQLSPCDTAVFLTQIGGEYAEKLEQAGLTLITKQPEEAIMIPADGRRMWRIFDNLMNNICKYAQSGTRVYLTLERIGDQAVLCFKNTSRDPLNISEEELMERFVRGDAARHTDGNGLGLSIAKSLAELQGGSLQLEIDGDLFKVTLTFPII